MKKAFIKLLSGTPHIPLLRRTPEVGVQKGDVLGSGGPAGPRHRSQLRTVIAGAHLCVKRMRCAPTLAAQYIAGSVYGNSIDEAIQMQVPENTYDSDVDTLAADDYYFHQDDLDRVTRTGPSLVSVWLGE
jgi:hypothetical protein